VQKYNVMLNWEMNFVWRAGSFSCCQYFS